MILARLFGFRRLLRENKELKARIRELDAELRQERSDKYQLMLAMTDRTLTAAGCFGLPKEVTQPKERREAKAATPEPSPFSESYLNAVREEGLKLGKSTAEIETMIGRLKRGEPIFPQFEEEEFTLPN